MGTGVRRGRCLARRRATRHSRPWRAGPEREHVRGISPCWTWCDKMNLLSHLPPGILSQYCAAGARGHLMGHAERKLLPWRRGGDSLLHSRMRGLPAGGRVALSLLTSLGRAYRVAKCDMKGKILSIRLSTPCSFHQNPIFVFHDHSLRGLSACAPSAYPPTPRSNCVRPE